jgi:hypothetical protein
MFALRMCQLGVVCTCKVQQIADWQMGVILFVLYHIYLQADADNGMAHLVTFIHILTSCRCCRCCSTLLSWHACVVVLNVLFLDELHRQWHSKGASSTRAQAAGPPPIPGVRFARTNKQGS